MSTQIAISPPTPVRKAKSSGCDSRTLALAKADLARSGLTPDDAESEGIFAVDDASSVNPDFAAKPALIFPYRRFDGRPATFERDGKTLLMCRARYLAHPGLLPPKGRKYDQPKGSGVQIYFPRGLDLAGLRAGDVTDICIVEGEKKAIALAKAGIPCIGVGGVDCFRQGKALHPDLESAFAKCERVYIVFDSDIETKPNIQAAEWRLAGDIALLGPRVHPVRLPAAPSGEKIGADDYIVAHGKEKLDELILSTPALGERRADAALDKAISVSELMKLQVRPVEELVPGFVEKGVANFIAGKGGSHKSRLAMQIGLCLNAGQWIPGLGGPQSVADEAPTATLVFISAEDDEHELARRAQAIKKRLKLPDSDAGEFIPRKGKDSALVVMHENSAPEVRPFYHQMIARLQGIDGHKIVVLDSAYDFVRFAGRAKIDEDAVNYFIKVVLQGICDKADATLLIPWHPSQAGSSRGEMDGWSVAWHNAPRARLAISESSDVEDSYELKAVKRNHAPKGQPISLKYDDGALLPLETCGHDTNREALRKACIDNAITAAKVGLPFTLQRNIPHDVLRAIGQSCGRSVRQKEAKQELEAAVRDGQLQYLRSTRHQAAGYYPPDEGAKELARNARRANVK